MSEGACALVLVDKSLVGDRKPAWIQGAASTSDSYAMAIASVARAATLVDLLSLSMSAKRAYAEAGVTKPVKENSGCGAVLGILERRSDGLPGAGFLRIRRCGRASLTAQATDKSLPVFNPSGGPQGANRSAPRAMVRIAVSCIAGEADGGGTSGGRRRTGRCHGAGRRHAVLNGLCGRREAEHLGEKFERLELISIPGLWAFNYNYFAGANASRFFHELKVNRRIMGTRCPSCERLLVPARGLFATPAWRYTTEWKAWVPKGRSKRSPSWHASFRVCPKPPLVMAYVTLDGADTALINLVYGRT